MASDSAFPYWRRWQSLFENGPSYQQRNVINRDVGQQLMWNCTWCSLPSESTGVELLPGMEQPPAQPWGQKHRTDMGKHHSAVSQHCLPPQNKSSKVVKCCHSTKRITEVQKDAMMCPRCSLESSTPSCLPGAVTHLSEQGVWRLELSPAQPAQCPALLGPSLLTGEQHFSQPLFSPALTSRKFALKILP